jgi:hypothetical protein
MSKVKLIKQYFLRRPQGTGYHAKHVHKVPKGKVKEYQDQGYCRDTTPTLPAGLPGREAFMEAGLESIDGIKHLKDFQQVDGIGPSTAEDLEEWFSKDES